MPTVKIGTQPPISPFFAGPAADGDVGAPANIGTSAAPRSSAHLLARGSPVRHAAFVKLWRDPRLEEVHTAKGWRSFSA
jgi:hypothetical protein